MPEKQPPHLEQLTNAAVARFEQQRLFINPGGHIEIYDPTGAAEDTITELHLPARTIALVLSAQTRLTPHEVVGLDGVAQSESWDDFFHWMATYILREEVYRRPGVREEMRIRQEEESKLDFPEL